MSMLATFVQVDEAELSRIKADPSLAESLFAEDAPALHALTGPARDRARAMGPRMIANALAGFSPEIRQQLESRFGRTTAEFAAGAGGDDILSLMDRGNRAATAPHESISLDKAWHGVHYVLCGEAQPGATLLSQAVLGGSELEEGEGFSGYGAPRYFTAKQVAEIAGALNRPGLELEAAARFDPVRMAQLSVYPGWQPSHLDWVLDAFRRLRTFYAGAARTHHAIITCLV